MAARSIIGRAMVRALALALLSPGGVISGQSVSKPAAKSLSANKAADFDAARAYEHVRRMVEIGPRPAGSEGIKKAQEYIIKELKSYGLKVTEDNFVATTPRGPVAMKNIIAELTGEKPGALLIAGHYDTKLQEGFVGANDGGSSTAAVLEMARALAKSGPEYTLWFVLFDGEEAVVEWGAMNGMDNTYGSRHMVSKLKADGALDRVKAMILVDMIGDKNLNLKREGESTEWLVNLMWATARKAGHDANYMLEEQYISDDHIPFKGAGIPVIDFIDFDYGPDHSYWHTSQDTLDKISGESMKAVGDVIIAALPDLFKRLNNPPPKPAKPAAQ
ncbi:MAG TPA: M28 family peptidase [Blastocatellia bacterium]|nr:M28 family peptidase [Blastocatellia bacterium]